MSFGCIPDFSSVYIRGIRNITPMDIVFAEELGYRIKLLGVARQTDKGIEQSVEPCLVPETSPLAVVDGNLYRLSLYRIYKNRSFPQIFSVSSVVS